MNPDKLVLDIPLFLRYKSCMNVDVDKFFRQLTALAENDRSMTTAAENIKKDWQSDHQPHGNIKPPITVRNKYTITLFFCILCPASTASTMVTEEKIRIKVINAT